MGAPSARLKTIIEEELREHQKILLLDECFSILEESWKGDAVRAVTGVKRAALGGAMGSAHAAGRAPGVAADIASALTIPKYRSEAELGVMTWVGEAMLDVLDVEKGSFAEKMIMNFV